MQALDQLAAAMRARPALRPRFLDLGAVDLSASELGDFTSMSLSLESCPAAKYGAELDDAFEFGRVSSANGQYAVRYCTYLDYASMNCFY